MNMPSIEIIPGAYANPPPQRQRASRWHVFLLTLVLCLAVGLGFTFLRPPIYQTAATLLTVKPQSIDQRSTAADLEHVAIQRQLLLSEDLVGTVQHLLQADGFDIDLTAGELRKSLSVALIPDTNLVELRAEGRHPELLQSAVNHWAEAYVKLRAAQISAVTDQTTAELSEEQSRLQAKLGEKRAEITAFRDRYDIFSMEREENQVLSRLKGLQVSLNKAQERLVAARSRRTAVASAIAKRQPVVPEQDKANLNAMQTQARQIRAQLAELEKRYTREYLARDPKLKALPGELAQLELNIRQVMSEGRGQVLADADQELEAANAALSDLETALAVHKQQVAAFTTRFAEHKNLQQELAALQQLVDKNQDQLTRIEITNRQKYPPLQIVDPAPLPIEPVRPLYWRDAGIATGISLLLALFATWLADYLTGRHQRKESTTSSIHIYGENRGGMEPTLQYMGDSTQALPPTGSPPQLQTRPQALEIREIQALLNAAPTDMAWQMALLLSGVAPEELQGSTIIATNTGGRVLQVAGTNARSILLAPGVWALLADQDGAAQVPYSAQDLRAMLAITAVDAGLANPAAVTPEALRHTYLVYLVRQGVRLNELATVTGRIPPERLAAYTPYSPPGAKYPLSEIERVYPAFFQ